MLYDEDCGFCKWSLDKILAWDRSHKLRPVPIQSEEGQRLLAAVPEEQRLDSWHLVEPWDGELRRRCGGAALRSLAGRAPAGRRRRARSRPDRARLPRRRGQPRPPRSPPADRRELLGQALARASASNSSETSQSRRDDSGSSANSRTPPRTSFPRPQLRPLAIFKVAAADPFESRRGGQEDGRRCALLGVFIVIGGVAPVGHRLSGPSPRRALGWSRRSCRPRWSWSDHGASRRARLVSRSRHVTCPQATCGQSWLPMTGSRGLQTRRSRAAASNSRGMPDARCWASHSRTSPDGRDSWTSIRSPRCSTRRRCRLPRICSKASAERHCDRLLRPPRRRAADSCHRRDRRTRHRTRHHQPGASWR